jgi:hypothetical protein
MLALDGWGHGKDGPAGERRGHGCALTDGACQAMTQNEGGGVWRFAQC